ncbi:unnamed protein product [Musa acuminata subsp. malaccensis]|uniref:(wild Malaysian banana) hypothetical protein n=1 Tax=Musa acuminata subsp. malaccensis TaxID=214687 RepID=A0A804JSF7_MUSAM|nr:unnamed protein product [Musa acuminata subsp. malaccensis]
MLYAFLYQQSTFCTLKNCNSTKIVVVAIYQSKLNHTNSMYIVLSSISLKNKGSIRNPRYGDSAITKFSFYMVLQIVKIFSGWWLGTFEFTI